MLRTLILAGVVGVYSHGAAAAESCVDILGPSYAHAFAFVPPTLEPDTANRKVFAHYFAQFPRWISTAQDGDYYAEEYLNPVGDGSSGHGSFLRDWPLNAAYVKRPADGGNWFLSNYKVEICLARAIGLDGFSFDILDDDDLDTGTHVNSTFNRVQLMMQAANAVDPNFKIMLMPDMTSAWAKDQTRLRDGIEKLSHYPAAMRLDDSLVSAPTFVLNNAPLLKGKLVVAPFSAQQMPASWWDEWKRAMLLKQVPVALVPVFQGWDATTATGPASTTFADNWKSVSHGYSDWGPASLNHSMAWIWKTSATIAHQRDRIWMAPVRPQDMRPRAGIYWEAANSAVFRETWNSAISPGTGQDPSDWVQVITWNDYGESTHIAPSMRTQHALYDLAAYYIAWFKSGTEPQINKNVLYYLHRQQSTVSVANPGTAFSLQRASQDPATNDIEVLAFLNTACDLNIVVGSNTYPTKYLSPGVTSIKVPLTQGTPSYTLTCSGESPASFTSPAVSNTGISYHNLLYVGGSGPQ